MNKNLPREYFIVFSNLEQQYCDIRFYFQRKIIGHFTFKKRFGFHIIDDKISSQKLAEKLNGVMKL